MAQDEGKRDEKIDFTAEGEVFGYISLDQAEVLAMRTARETPGAYGSAYVDVPMAFDVVESDETEDHYRITLSFRPQGKFRGKPGREQFFIEKEGTVAHRQVLSALRRRQRLPVLPAVVGLVAAGGIAAVAAVFALGGPGAESALDAPESTLTPAPTAAPVIIPATERPAPTPTLVPATPTLAPAPTPTPFLIETIVPLPTSTPSPGTRGTPTLEPPQGVWLYPVSPDSPLDWRLPRRGMTLALETGSVDRVVGLRFRLLSEIPQLPPGYASSGQPFYVAVHSDHDSDPIPYTFLKPGTMTVFLRASAAAAAGGVESDLVIQRYREGGQSWETLATTVDFGASIATAKVDQLGIFVLTIRKPEQTLTQPPSASAPIRAAILEIQCGPELKLRVRISIKSEAGIASFSVWSTWGSPGSVDRDFSPPYPTTIDEVVIHDEENSDTVDRLHQIGLRVLSPGAADPFLTYGLEPDERCPGHFLRPRSAAPLTPPLTTVITGGELTRGGTIAG